MKRVLCASLKSKILVIKKLITHTTPFNIVTRKFILLSFLTQTKINIIKCNVLVAMILYIIIILAF